MNHLPTEALTALTRTEPVGSPVERPVRPASEAWVREWFAKHYACEPSEVFNEMAEALTLAAALKFAQAAATQERKRLQAGRDELVAAWNDLPDALRCHPGLKRLYAAAQRA